jgi:hypothetical protein
MPGSSTAFTVKPTVFGGHKPKDFLPEDAHLWPVLPDEVQDVGGGHRNRQ